MTAYVFPGQGAQFTGMGHDLYESNGQARQLFDQADDILGYSLKQAMFEGSEEEQKQTKITQPAIFTYSVVTMLTLGADARPDAVAGHSLGEFSALVAAGALDFADGLRLVQQRAMAMQRACELQPGTMAAVLGLDDEVIERICAEVDDVVVPANYNSPGQLVISGSLEGVRQAGERLREAGAKRFIELAVGGAFHSPLMQPAQDELRATIEATDIRRPACPIYQNADARPSTDPAEIKEKLIRQLTAPVRWTQTIQNMRADGITDFVEVGGKVLQGLIKKIDRAAVVSGL